MTPSEKSKVTSKTIFNAETYPESCRKSKMEFFAKMVNGFSPLNNFAKSSILDVWQVVGVFSGVLLVSLSSFFNHSTPGVYKKAMQNFDKPATENCRFLWVCMTLKWRLGVAGQKHQ